MGLSIEKIRNVCLLGHGGDGKTSVAEAMLFNAKAIDRLGKTADGNTVCDSDPEEQKRGISISAAVAPIDWDGHKINIIDTPGFFDFEGEVVQAMRAAGSAVIVVSGKDGVNVGTEKAFKKTSKAKMPKLFFVNRLDEENADFSKTVKGLKDAFGPDVCPISLPIVEGGKITGYYDLVEKKGRVYSASAGKWLDVAVPDSMQGEIEELDAMLQEAVAETDEELMEKYFNGETFSVEEVRSALHKAALAGDIYPVLGGSAVTLAGIGLLLDSIVHLLPNPSNVIDGKPSDPAALFVFKTVADPFVGKMSYFKVISGSIKAGMSLTNRKNGTQEKVGHMFITKGKKQVEVEELSTGDIGYITKLQSANTGDVLCVPGFDAEVAPMEYPAPCLSMAVFAKNKGDEDKIAQGFARLAEEDLTFKFGSDPETKELVLSGMGDMHLDVLTAKLKTKFGAAVDLKKPRVAYREAIRKKVKVEGKHKKQSGGHGQYGHVWIEFEPYEGDDLLFEEKIFGGSVPKNFHPAVEKGLRDAAKKGVLAGYPMVGLKATLVDGSYHDVDSSEMSFKMAASIAYKEGIKIASPVILEPVGELKVYIPDANMGDIMGDINKRRGHVMGMNAAEDGYQEVIAEVPASEMTTYAIDLRSMTRGRGSFSFNFIRYQDAPANVVQAVIEEAKKNAESEEV